jgi:uncharacterized membrane protein
MQTPSQKQSEIWRKDPKNWKHGFNIYYNPEDRRIFPRKYYKELGWTVNFANKKSVLVFIAALVILPIILFFIISFFKK